MALAAYATEYGDIQHLSPSQLDLVVKVLSYIEEITKSISCDSASVSTTACQLLITKMSELSCEDVTQVPSPKRKKNDNKILKCFFEILEESGACIAGDIGDTEVEQYFKRTSDTISLW